MSFCKFSSQSVANNKTEIDNIFINDFLPYAPENAVKVYLYGLYKCSSSSAYDNTIENFSKVLKIPEDEIMDIFSYWENEGLVQILNAVPVEIRYLPLKNVLNNNRKYNLSKYGNFSDKAQEIIEGRMISPTEYGEYFDTIETFHIEPEAFLMIMKYCVNTKGGNVGYPYIIAVAKNWAYDNVRTVSDVEDRLITYERNSDDIKLVLKTMGSKKTPTIEEKELFLKWTKELGFELGVIIEVVKLKKSSWKMTFEKLDEILMGYYEMKLMSITDILDYENNKTSLFKLAKAVSKELGLYYENVESIVEKYISKWISMGFGEDAILKIAEYCFLSSVRKFEGMNSFVQKFYKLGLLSVQGLNEYFNDILAEDEEIKEILKLLGVDRQVTSYDREFYKNWKYNWNISFDLIKYGASLACGKSQAMRYLNGILANWNSQKIKTVEEAKKTSTFVFDEKPVEINYDKEVDRVLSERRQNAVRIADENLNKARANEKFKNLEKFEAETKIELALILADGKDSTEIENKLKQIEEDKRKALLEIGLSEKDINPVYTCEICKDTGKGKCDCRKKIKERLLSGESATKIASENKKVITKENITALFDSLVEVEI
ncbi:MAG: DnaD domain protein [Christensenellales bacterium]